MRFLRELAKPIRRIGRGERKRGMLIAANEIWNDQIAIPNEFSNEFPNREISGSFSGAGHGEHIKLWA